MSIQPFSKSDLMKINHIQSAYSTLFTTFILILLSSVGKGQFSFQGNVDFDGTYAQNKSHYYYNEINPERLGWSAGLSEARLYTGYERKNTSFHFQQSISRSLGRNVYKYQIEQINVQFASQSGQTSLTVGRFIHPYGGFYNRQFSHKRNFLSAPLQYSHFINVSDKIGYQSGMGESGFQLDGSTEWGGSINYRYGYLNGLNLEWRSTDEKYRIESALGNRAALDQIFNSPLSIEWTTRLSMDVSWALSHGLSLRLSSFRKSTFEDFNLTDESQLKKYNQFQLGYDFIYGSSYFEVSGELGWSIYKVPNYSATDGFVLLENEVKNHSLNNLVGYVDIKVEPPFLTGYHLALRSEYLSFGEFAGQSWDNNVWRQSILIGYKINRSMLVRAQYSIQHVENKTWDQDFLRMALTLHL
jgi:hypothetical protein